VVVAYDDSDGWYDHVTPPLVNGSTDAVNDQAALCGTNPASGGYADRCGYGPRQPLLVISPFSKSNYVDHKQTDQTSILKFIEENWRTGGIGDASFDSRAGSLTSMFDFWHHPNTRPVLLDPTTGAVTRH
jgi:phospholipase C